MSVSALKNFLKMESTAGFLLVSATAIALLVSNSPLQAFYQEFLNVRLAVSLGELSVDKPLLLWINDGLMAIFFMLVGLEIKREILDGQLSSADQVVLPAVAALGGFLFPALVYAAINWNTPETLEGWAIPAATDIAFALGVLTVLGRAVPLALKVFLMTVAIFDDVAAIVVIALFYTQDLSVTALFLAAVGGVVLVLLNRSGVTRISPYILVGVFVWICVLKSGVHATLAGIAVAIAIPLNGLSGDSSPLRHLEHALHPWVAFGILPVFAFANAGVSFTGVDTDVLFGPVSLGIVAGLFLGKQLGVFASVWVMVKLGLARLPEGTNWTAIYGVSLLTGIGFTMSLFIGSLAFERGQFDYLAATRVGVLIGSLASAAAGYVVLKRALKNRSTGDLASTE